MSGNNDNIFTYIFRYAYAIGGQDGTENLSTVERYDPHTNTWMLVAPLPQPLRFMTSVSYKGKLFVFGGEGATDVTRSAYRYGILFTICIWL